MSSDKFYTDTVSDKFTGDDDEKDLETTGKGLVVRNTDDGGEKPAWLASFKRYYCSNCRQGIHNTPENDRRCKRNGCDCRCKTHYIGMDGRARPYGTPDDSAERLEKDRPKIDADNDAEFQKLMEEYRRLRGDAPDDSTEVIL
jgi:hypothetical protein